MLIVKLMKEIGVWLVLFCLYHVKRTSDYRKVMGIHVEKTYDVNIHCGCGGTTPTVQRADCREDDKEADRVDRGVEREL